MSPPSHICRRYQAILCVMSKQQPPFLYIHSELHILVLQEAHPNNCNCPSTNRVATRLLQYLPTIQLSILRFYFLLQCLEAYKCPIGLGYLLCNNYKPLLRLREYIHFFRIRLLHFLVLAVHSNYRLCQLPNSRGLHGSVHLV